MIDREWSAEVGEAAWIAERLAPAGTNVVTAVVPGGFAAYVRILHPAAGGERADDRAVRWREVVAWSGLALRGDAAFHAVALPPRAVAGPPPWRGQGPRQGSLVRTDAEALFPLLRAHGGGGSSCWCCLWDGWGWSGVRLSSDGSRELEEDPLSAAARAGPRVALPNRSYLLFRGAVEEALIVRAPPGESRSANLFWPEHRQWCVATEIDLTSTYVGGPQELIDALVADTGLEAIAVAPDAPAVGPVAPWVERWAGAASDELLGRGRAVVGTPLGTVESSLERPWRGRPVLSSWSESLLGHRGHATRVLTTRGAQDRRGEIVASLVQEIVGLVGG